jgi:16S rRNA (cytosine1407-C5)-methyltransferase
MIKRKKVGVSGVLPFQNHNRIITMAQIVKNNLLPDAFVSTISDIMPSAFSLEEFEEICHKPLRKSIRVNTVKCSVEKFKLLAKDKNWELEPIPWCKEGFWITEESSTPLGNSFEHMAGLFYIQEASSMLPVEALFQHEGFELVLDMAAAPGSKTTQLAAKMDNSGLLVANEYAASRIKILNGNVSRCGIINTVLTHHDARVFGAWLHERFDAILLDAPCSGEGSLRKDKDAMKNWSLESVYDIANTQKDLITSAFNALKPGGTLVYSTCTLNKFENQEVAQYLLEQFGSSVEVLPLSELFDGCDKVLTDEGYLHVFPQVFDCEGFFIAKFRKLNSSALPAGKKKIAKFPFTLTSKKQVETINQTLKQALGFTIPQTLTLWERDNEIWLFPAGFKEFAGEMRYQRIGLKLAETHKKGFKWQHQAIIALATVENSNHVSLDINDAREWFKGRDIRPNYLDDVMTSKQKTGEVIVAYQGEVIGLGKWVSNRIKNGLPRELVRDNNLF